MYRLLTIQKYSLNSPLDDDEQIGGKLTNATNSAHISEALEALQKTAQWEKQARGADADEICKLLVELVAWEDVEDPESEAQRVLKDDYSVDEPAWVYFIRDLELIRQATVETILNEAGNLPPLEAVRGYNELHNHLEITWEL